MYTLKKWGTIDKQVWRVYHKKNDQARLQRLLTFIDKLDQCFELGCGYGFQAGIIMKYRHVSSYNGCDINNQCVQSCNDMCKANNFTGTFYIDNIFDLNFDKIGEPTVILCIEVLEHIKDYKEAFAQIAKTCTNKNKLLFSVPKYNKLRHVPGHCNNFKKEHLQDLFMQNNLKILHHEEVANTYEFFGLSKI